MFDIFGLITPRTLTDIYKRTYRSGRKKRPYDYIKPLVYALIVLLKQSEQIK